MYEDKFFETLPVVTGAEWAVRKLLRFDIFDPYILTKPVGNSPKSYQEKASWIANHFAELSRKINMSHHKELLAGPDRILIDDDIKWKEGWEEKGGKFIHFNYSPDNVESNRREWERIVEELLNEYKE